MELTISNLFVLFIQLILFQFSNCYIIPKAFQSRTYRILNSTSRASDLYNILTAKENEIPKVADFLSTIMFGDDLSESQRRELSRLELKDLSYRYGQLVGPRKYKSVLVVAKSETEIIGCAGIDSQVSSYSKIHFLTEIDIIYDKFFLVLP